MESRSIGQRGDVLADFLRRVLIELELDPVGLMRQLAHLSHQTEQVVVVGTCGHGSVVKAAAKTAALNSHVPSSARDHVRKRGFRQEQVTEASLSHYRMIRCIVA